MGTRRNVHTAGVRAIALLACMIGATLGAGGLAGAAEEGDAPSKITVVATPSETQGNCVPAGIDLSYTTFSDDTMFRLTVTAGSPQCTPIEAFAVIYAMPGGGVAWPQQLVEKTEVTISEAGTYEITFMKDCAPVQFDVLTGATPDTISPTGPWHGPLLFPLDTGTTQQYWGDPNCNPTTTTTSVLPTTTVPESTTTTEPEVAGSTTIPVDTTVPPPEVDGVTTVPAGNGTQVGGVSTSREPAALALTGDTSTALSAVGGLLLAGGLALVMLQRRRSA